MTNEETYCVALHDIGHVIDPGADSRQFSFVIEDKSLIAVPGEVGAWRFAMRHALRWTKAMQDRLYASLARHARRATREERETIVVCVREGCFKVSDGAWCSFEQLDAKCDALRRAD